jgi:cyclopropane fatty-acyl-phospholipid synthase-like methyltransferase
MNDYWDRRFQAEGKIWGDAPSRTAERAREIFQRARVKKLLVPGSGYGRNTRPFAESGFEVTGVEISRAAYAMAREFDELTHHYNASALDLSFLPGSYDAVYGFNVLHLFREDERKLFIRQCRDKVKAGGLMFFTVFSEKEPSFGQGREVEKNTFESKPGRPVHYFTAGDLKAHFKGTETVATGIMADPEDHGAEGPHTHRLRYICVRV